MAETPNKDIEKQLRDYAQRRRDAAGTPAMHPATRAMLQAEVKQRAGTAPAETSPATAQRAGWTLFWPRFAFAFAIVAVIGLAGMFLFPPNNKVKGDFTIAKLDEPVAAAVPAEADKLKTLSPTVAPEPASTPAAPVAMNELHREVATKAAAESAPATEAASFSKAERSDVSAARQPPIRAAKSAPAQLKVVGYVDTTNFYADSPSATLAKQQASNALFDSNGKKATGSVLGSAATSSGKSARGGGEAQVQVQTAIPNTSQDRKERSLATAAVDYEARNKDVNRGQLSVANDGLNNMTQRYRNLAVAEDSRRSGKINVLEEFTVEQNGQALTIVDRDGSVYNGFARQASAERQNVNAESGNPIQMVPNSNNGGRGGAALNQTTMNRGYSQNQSQGQAEPAQNSGASQALQIQNAPELQNYFFRVEGTNRSLNQRVVVTGNMLQNNLGNVQYNNGNSQAFRSQQQQQQNAPAGNQYNFNNRQAPAYNNAINGRVQVDNSKAVEFNAMSVDQQ